jgi:hypothetical protein
MATRSPIAATAVASPPAPVPAIVMSPAYAPVTMAAFCGPIVRAKSDARGTNTGATQAVSVDRSPANRFDDDLDVAGEQVVTRVGPDDAVRGGFGLSGALVARAPVADVGELEAGNRIRAGEPPGDRRPDGTETEDADQTAWRAWTVAGSLKRVENQSPFSSSPFKVRLKVDTTYESQYGSRSVRL